MGEACGRWGRDTVGGMGSILQLLPHRPPFLLIDRVVEVEAGRVVAEKRVAAGDPLLGRGLSGPMCIEALSQTAACLMGSREPGQRHLGYLVAAQGWKFQGMAEPGETVTLEARLVAELGALSRFEGRARVGERELASGTMTFAVTLG